MVPNFNLNYLSCMFLDIARFETTTTNYVWIRWYNYCLIVWVQLCLNKMVQLLSHCLIYTIWRVHGTLGSTPQELESWPSLYKSFPSPSQRDVIYYSVLHRLPQWRLCYEFIILSDEEKLRKFQGAKNTLINL